MKWENAKVLVTGGASFIASHAVDKLVEMGCKVRAADNLSSGKMINLEQSINDIEFMEGDLRDRSFANAAVKDMEIIFHLAADHGGRGYIDTHPADCAANMALDGIVFQAAQQAGVERITMSSSACVYPCYLQDEEGSNYLLKEEDADPFVRDRALADLEYGWAKLMGEMSLRAYHKQYGMKTSAVRFSTAYGPRENETHAIIALISKAFIKQDPFEIWGTGEQDRNFTYVSDLVDSMIVACEKIEDGSALNGGRDDRLTINETVEIVFDIVGWRPEKIFRDTSKPTGVNSRASDLTFARTLGWEPKVAPREGFEKTIEWYFNSHSVDEVKNDFERRLFER